MPCLPLASTKPWCPVVLLALTAAACAPAPPPATVSAPVPATAPSSNAPAPKASAAAPLEGRVASQTAEPAAWQPLFDGHGLSGWLPKIAGHALGENFGQTFRVVSGLLRVNYDAYGEFAERFGALYYATPLSHFRLRVEMRFAGDVAPGAPDWARLDAGIQYHGQPPESLALGQKFPTCLEMNLLGSAAGQPRFTGGVCTPATHVVREGVIDKEHCPASSHVVVPAGEWSVAEIEVHGSGPIRHYINGKLTAAYERAEYDVSDAVGNWLAMTHPGPLGTGYISLQSNGQPYEVRRVELQQLDSAHLDPAQLQPAPGESQRAH